MKREKLTRLAAFALVAVGFAVLCRGSERYDWW